MPRPRPKMEVICTKDEIMNWVSKGKTRQYILDKLQEEGLTNRDAISLYYTTLKEMVPNEEMYTSYKNATIQKNLDRLDKVVEDNISGSTADKAIALKALDMLNKMISAYAENTATIAQTAQEDNQQVITITFDK